MPATGLTFMGNSLAPSKTSAALTALAILALLACCLDAQQPSASSSFEAAAITPVPNPYGAFHFNILPNRLDVKNMSLSYLIQQAYDLADYQVIKRTGQNSGR